MEIIGILIDSKDAINRKCIVPHKKSPADCTVDELLGTLRDEYFYRFSGRFSNMEPMSSEKMKRFMEIAGLIYDKSILSCKKSASDYTTRDLFDILYDSFYFESHLINSPGKPILFMGIISMLYDKWADECKKSYLISGN
jgi:hypothetical protein